MPFHCWETYFKDGKKEWVYFFDADTIESLDWRIVRDMERGLLERREIDLNYLKRNDFTVTSEHLTPEEFKMIPIRK